MVRFCFLFINPNPLTGFAVLRLIKEAIRLDNQRTNPSFQYSQLDARDHSCCATSGDICTQFYELESTSGVPKSRGLGLIKKKQNFTIFNQSD